MNWLYALPFINNCYLSNGTGGGTIYCPSCGSKGRFSYWFVSISSPGLVFLSMLMNSDAFLLLSSWSCLSRDSDSRCWAEQRNQNVPNKLIIIHMPHLNVTQFALKSNLNRACSILYSCICPRTKQHQRAVGTEQQHFYPQYLCIHPSSLQCPIKIHYFKIYLRASKYIASLNPFKQLLVSEQDGTWASVQHNSR